MFQVNTAPCGLLFSLSYQNGQKRGSNIQGRKVRARAKTGTAMSHRDTSQVPVQPTGLSQLPPPAPSGNRPCSFPSLCPNTCSQAPSHKPIQTFLYTEFTAQYKPADRLYTERVSAKQTNVKFTKWPGCSSRKSLRKISKVELAAQPRRAGPPSHSQESSPGGMPHTKKIMSGKP